MNNFQISTLPPFAKLFVGIFATLMILICVWAVIIYYVETGVVDIGNLPEYMKSDSAIKDIPESDLSVNKKSEIPDFRENVGLAHTHINGQTLLFFAIGLVFLFTSAPAKTKKTIFWLFGVSIIVHVIGLTGSGYASIYDDILAFSGIGIIISILYIAFWIFIDLSKKASTN